MEHKSLIKIIRKQHLTRLIPPFLIIIISALVLITNPFRDSLRPVTVSSFYEAEEQYELGNRYIKFTASKLYYTGYDYSVRNKIKANIYYALADGRCFYVIIPSASKSGIATILDNYTFSARLTENSKLYSELNRVMSDQINFSPDGLDDISSSIFISQYDYNQDFTRFVLIIFAVILVISSVFLIYELLAVINVYISMPVIKLKKYGDCKKLFNLAFSEFDTAGASGRKNVYVTDSFLIIVTGNDTDIIPLDNVTWIYDYNEVRHKGSKSKIYHPLCIVTDARKIYKIRHMSEKGINTIINSITENRPGIMIGYSNVE